MKTILALLCFALTVGAAPGGFGNNPNLRYGLIGWWTMNEGSGTVAADYSTNWNAGTFAGDLNPAWTNGVVGCGLYFANGGDTYGSQVTVPFKAVYNRPNSSALSICCWIYRTTNSPTYETLVDHRTAAGCNFEMVLSSSITAGQKPLVFYNGAFATDSKAFIPTNVWTHVAIVVSGSTTTFYTNGVSAGTVNYGIAQQNTSINVYLGVTNQSGLVQHYKGIMDDVRIYARALTASEIQMLYGGGYGSP